MFVNRAHEFYVKQRTMDMENIIRYFIGLYEDDIDINDAEIQKSVFKKYNFDPSESEMSIIKERVEQAIR